MRVAINTAAVVVLTGSATVAVAATVACAVGLIVQIRGGTTVLDRDTDSYRAMIELWRSLALTQQLRARIRTRPR